MVAPFFHRRALEHRHAGDASEQEPAPAKNAPESASFFQAFPYKLYLSRACLGKLIVFSRMVPKREAVCFSVSHQTGERAEISSSGEVKD